MEQLQRRASKFILHDFSSNYKTRLLSLDLLPLMMMFELNDVLFFINCLKNPSVSFDIFKYVSFGTSSTRSGSHKLRHKGSNSNSQRHFYFHRLIRLWNFLPIVDLPLSAPVIKSKLKATFGLCLLASLTRRTYVLFISSVPAITVYPLLVFQILIYFNYSHFYFCIYSALLFFVVVFCFFCFFVVFLCFFGGFLGGFFVVLVARLVPVDLQLVFLVSLFLVLCFSCRCKS